jgi:hypothetical protein
MQLYFHSPLRSSIPRPVYFPIFRRIKLAEGADGQVRPVVEVHGEGETAELTGVVHERNFFKNCWSMVRPLFAFLMYTADTVFPDSSQTTSPINASTTLSSRKH